MLESEPRPGELKANEKVRNYFASCMAERQEQSRHASGEFGSFCVSVVHGRIVQ